MPQARSIRNEIRVQNDVTSNQIGQTRRRTLDTTVGGHNGNCIGRTHINQHGVIFNGSLLAMRSGIMHWKHFWQDDTHKVHAEAEREREWESGRVQGGQIDECIERAAVEANNSHNVRTKPRGWG